MRPPCATLRSMTDDGHSYPAVGGASPEPRGAAALALRAGNDLESTRACLWRTRRLFDLAVTASGEIPSRIARTIGLDLRSIEGIRETPTVGYVARIASALGIDAASAVSLIGSTQTAADPTSRSQSSSAAETRHGDALLDAIEAADLDDDRFEIDRLASSIAADPERPLQFSLAMLLSARSASAEGEVVEARRRLDFALGFRSEASALPLLREVDRIVRLEAALGMPWEALDFEWPAAFASVPPAVSAGATAMLPASQRRMKACERVRGLFREIAHPLGDVAESLAALGEVTECAIHAECARSAAWCASLAGIAALRALETHRLSPRCERSAMELLVRSQFSIDEMLATCDPRDHAPLLRRRQRLALHEWSDRARRGEVCDAFVDELDVREVRTMFVRFPGARKSILAEMFARESRREIL